MNGLGTCGLGMCGESRGTRDGGAIFPKSLSHVGSFL